MSYGRSPFHAGEKEVQAKCNVSEEAEELGRHMLQPLMSEQHMAFFQSLEFAFVASQESVSNTRSRVWASVVAGKVGFVHCAARSVLNFDNSSITHGDPINVTPGSLLGVLGLEFHTRRRNRLNGVVQAGEPSASDVSVRVQQAFGNCPKYIQTRRLKCAMNVPNVATTSDKPAALIHELGELVPEAVQMIKQADTFFLATSAGPAVNSTANAKGCDMSHRGGPVGFVVVNCESESQCHCLKWPDYAGNNMFNSLGNITVCPQVGLLFIDFETGNTLQLTGTAHIDYDDSSLTGANRVVHFRTQAWRYALQAVPMAAPAPTLEASPYNPAANDDSGFLVECVSVQQECRLVKTFEFKIPPSLQQSMLANPFLPGQYASFDFTTTSGQTINRTWTVSSDLQYIQHHNCFKVTIKKVGAVSSFMHEHVHPGQSLHLIGITGTFTPQFDQLRAWGLHSVLLVAAGIGITPIKAMLSAFVAQQIQVTVLYSVRVLQDAAFLEEMTHILTPKLGEKAVHKIYVTVTGPSRDAVIVPRAHSNGDGSGAVAAMPNTSAEACTLLTGRVNAAMLQQVAPRFMEMCVYMCGPVPFMDYISRTMHEELHYPHIDRIYIESFNF